MVPHQAPIFFDILYKVLSSDYFFITVILIFFDFLTGVLKSIKLKKTNSSIGLSGLIKHIGVLLSIIIIIGIYYFNENIYTNFSLYTFVVFLYYFYALSIVENLVEIGVPIPNFIKNRFFIIKITSNLTNFIRIKNHIRFIIHNYYDLSLLCL